MRPHAALLGALLVPALPLLAAAPAQAATTIICVNRPADPECGLRPLTIGDAITAAANDATDSVIRIGAGLYTGPFTFDGASSPLTVQGNGNGTGDQATVFTVPTNNGTPYLTTTTATLRNVRVQVKDIGATGVRATGGSTLQQVIVADTGTAVANNVTGFSVADSLVQESTANLDRGAGNTGMVVTGTNPQPAALRRVTVRSSESGIRAVEGPVAIENSVIDLGTTGVVGLSAGLPQTAIQVTLDARYVTVVGGVAGSRGVEAYSDAAAVPSTVTLVNSIVRGPGQSLTADATGGTAAVNVSYSDYLTEQEIGAGAVNPGAGNLNVDPLFRGPSGDDLQLRVGSPVVDKASGLVTSGPDRNGDARAVDGDTNGSQLPDMGAYELQDPVAPKTTITAGPPARTNDNTPVFQFKADDNQATYQCRVDAGAFVACTSPVTTTPLPDGPHTFSVQATDRALNVEAAPVTRSFTVDTVKPNAKISKKPGKRFYKQRVKFKFSANEPGVTFQCKVDKKPWKKCTSAYRFNVKRGWHVFQVRATDGAGNVDPKPASYRFRRVKR
jgi:hypothetical protein